MYTVWYNNWNDQMCLFISGIPSAALAQRIANNLMEENFTRHAWIEKD